MYAFADLSDLHHPDPAADPIERELEEIEELRRRTLANRDILYCSPPARHLVEKEIPRLIDIIRRIRRGEGDAGAAPDSARWMEGLLRELRQEVGILRDLMERR